MESNKELSRVNGKDLFMLTNLDYESWAPKAMKHLLTYPGPWQWIKTGLEPTFIAPPLEIPAEAPPRQMQARARVRADEGGRVGEGRRARGRGREFMQLAEESDDEQDEGRLLEALSIG